MLKSLEYSKIGAFVVYTNFLLSLITQNFYTGLFLVPSFRIKGGTFFRKTFAKFIDKCRNIPYNKNNSSQVINNEF